LSIIMADAMTESVLSPTGQATTSVATALATHLTAPSSVAASAPELVNYRGALTPQHLDAPGTETGALLRGAAVHDLGWLRRIAVRGEDRFRWLSGMVTNAVETLPDRSGAYNLVLNAQGRIQGDVYVWRSGDDLELEITPEQCEVLLSHLDGFIIMDDVELIPLPDQAALGITGPDAGEVLAKLGIPVLPEELMSAAAATAEIPIQLFRSYGTVVPHYVLWASIEHIPALWQAILAAGASPVGAASLETLRIVEGIPAYGIDIQSRDLAQETSQTRALSFTKGCYLGQEIVERVRSRGNVHRTFSGFTLTGELPTSGTILQAEAKPVGELTSVARIPLSTGTIQLALGYIRREARDRGLALEYPGGTATPLALPIALPFALP
jgi:folate-binding protein YgfZ